MHTHQDWEGLAEMRRQEFERELRTLQQMAHAPALPPLWQKLAGRGIARVGRMLMQWGERVAMAEARRQTSPAR